MEDGAWSFADEEESLDGKYRIESWPRQFISRQGAKHNTSQLWLIYKNSSAGAFFCQQQVLLLFSLILNKANLINLILLMDEGVNPHLKLNEIL